MAKTKKRIAYKIEAEIYFDMDENVDIEGYLDNLRGIGKANVIDVRVVEMDEDYNVIP